MPDADPFTAPARRRLGHRPALDGLRALAITSVMLFHLPTRVDFEGGLFGVDVFFALSGFLVSSLLLEEFDNRGGIRLRAFLARRGWRLLPALAVFLSGYLLLAALFGDSPWFASNPFGTTAGPRVPLSEAARGAAAVATYGFNEFRADSITFPVLGHLWSLSVEGQFYLLFPIALAVILRYWKAWLLPITAVAATLSALYPWMVWHGGTGANAIYYGSFSRMQGLLIGSVGAQLWRMGYVGRVPVRVRRVASWASLGVLADLIFRVGNGSFKYLGALTVAAGAGTVLVVTLLEPDGGRALGWALSRRPVVWLGQRSYAVYLWHYAFACWTNLLPHSYGVPIAVGSSLVAAELSWRLVEAPCQRWARRRRTGRAVSPPAPMALAGQGAPPS